MREFNLEEGNIQLLSRLRGSLPPLLHKPVVITVATFMVLDIKYCSNRLKVNRSNMHTIHSETSSGQSNPRQSLAVTSAVQIYPIIISPGAMGS